MKTLADLITEVSAEYTKAVHDVFQEEIKPLLDKRRKMEKEAFDKAYLELVGLEREV